MHYGDTDAVASWIGSIANVKYPAPNRCEINCRPLSASMDVDGLTLAWSRPCGYSIYDGNCLVDRNQFRVPGVVQGIDGASITSGAFDALPDGWFSGGFVEWDIGGGEVDRRGIEQHVGGKLTLMGGSDGLTLSSAVSVYPGCPQTIQACNDKFDNLLRYGGFWHQPGKSPFDGMPIF